jgi:hypothetical protein
MTQIDDLSRSLVTFDQITCLAALCGRPREWQALFGLAEHIKARQSGPGTAADLAFGIAIALSRIDLRGPDPLLSVT